MSDSDSKKPLTQPLGGVYISSDDSRQILRYTKGMQIAAGGLAKTLEKIFNRPSGK